MAEDKQNVRIITVKIDGEGTLVIAVVDSGPVVKDFWGTDDYEFWYRVRADRIETLARRLNTTIEEIVDEINANWRGDQFYALEEILKEPGIEAEFSSYI